MILSSYVRSTIRNFTLRVFTFLHREMVPLSIDEENVGQMHDNSLRQLSLGIICQEK